MTVMRGGPVAPQPDALGFGSEFPTSDGPAGEPQPPVVLVGRLVSVRFVLSALRRRRKVWLSLAALGLVLGLAYHVIVPRTSGANTTLYLAHSPGTDDGVDMQNDLALLQTNAVTARAATLLGEPRLTPAKLLGKEPGTAVSDNILTINVSGPNNAEAIRRANAVAEAYLSFRGQQDQSQEAATAAALKKQIAPLQSQVNSLTTRINALGSSAQGDAASALVGEESADTAEISSLEQTMQQNQVGVITLTTGSRVLTPGTLVPVSKKKLFGLSGISGLIVGLIVGMGYVALQAIVSDRLRRRDEVASLLGAPVELSLRPVRHPKSRSDGWIRRAAVKPPGDVGLLASYLQRCMISQGARMTLLVIPLDDEVVPSAALAALAKRLADDGKSVLLTDLTDEGLLARGMDGMRVDDSSAIDRPRGNLQVHSPSSSQISDAPPWTTAQAEANAILTLASIDPGAGGWHLSWAKEAVILVTAGRSSAQRVNSAAALIRAAGIGVRCGVLLGADSEDESIGLLQPDSPLVRLPIEGVASS